MHALVGRATGEPCEDCVPANHEKSKQSQGKRTEGQLDGRTPGGPADHVRQPRDPPEMTRQDKKQIGPLDRAIGWPTVRHTIQPTRPSSVDAPGATYDVFFKFRRRLVRL